MAVTLECDIAIIQSNSFQYMISRVEEIKKADKLNTTALQVNRLSKEYQESFCSGPKPYVNIFICMKLWT
jgi:hypothetical protein